MTNQVRGSVRFRCEGCGPAGTDDHALEGLSKPFVAVCLRNVDDYVELGRQIVLGVVQRPSPKVNADRPTVGYGPDVD
jgi:hypothetical protein